MTDLAAQKYGFYMRGDSYWSQPFIWGWGGTLFTVNDEGKVTEHRRQFARVRQRLDVPQGQRPGQGRPGHLGLQDRLRQHERGLQGRHDHVHPPGPVAGRRHPHGRRPSPTTTNLVIATVPDGVNGKTGSPVGGHNWVVSLDVGEDADKAAAVASFLTYMTGARAAGGPRQEPRPSADQYRRLRRP